MQSLVEPSIERFPTVWSEVVENERRAAIEEERRRFADELHDVVAGHLSAVTLFLAAARQALPVGDARDFVDAAEKGVRDCWGDARRCADGLRSLELDRRGIAGVLASYAQRLAAASNTTITFEVHGSKLPLSEQVELSLLRVTQEAVTNSLLHASPRTVAIELTYGADGVGLKVSDDGTGFDMLRGSTGNGLWSMRDRARQAGGELAILTEPGHGTQVIMTLPLSDAQLVEPAI